MLFIDSVGLKNPGAQPLHWGWVVALPAVIVYLPGGHLVWALHEARVAVVLKNPGAHDSQPRLSFPGCVPIGQLSALTDIRETITEIKKIQMSIADYFLVL